MTSEPLKALPIGLRAAATLTAQGFAVLAYTNDDPITCEKLADLGCAFAQGYLFSEPIPGDDVPELVEAALAGMLSG